MGVLLTLIIVYLAIGIALSIFAYIKDRPNYNVLGYVQLTLLWPIAIAIILLLYFGKIRML